MSATIVKVIEVMAESPKSWEDAAERAIQKASKSVHGIKSLWVQDLKAMVENGKISSYRINCKVSFVLDE